MSDESTEAYRETLEDLVQSRDASELDEFLDELPLGESARTLSRMSVEEQCNVFKLLAPDEGARLFKQLPNAQVTDLLNCLNPPTAAAILSELESDEQVDLLSCIDAEKAVAILRHLDPETAQQIEVMQQYPADSAGGLMVTEFLAYEDSLTIGDVVDDMIQNADEYSSYNVQYAYVVSSSGKLVGVLQLRDLLLNPRKMRIAKKMIPNPLSVSVWTTLEELDLFFHRRDWVGVPVIDDEQKLVGVVQREDVESALGERAERTLLKFAGIIGGEELRSMSFATRSARRLTWLTVNVLLNLFAASVIAFYQETLSAVIALAVFLPMISATSGSAGSQAVAVSMRELVLGLIRPDEFRRVLYKEITVGMANGLVLGLLLGLLALLWQKNAYLGLVVGGALAINTVLAAVLGGCLPLLLRRLDLDAALISTPLLSTLVDMCGFMLVLGLAQLMLPLLTQ